MQKLKLFSKYDSETLFDKIRREITDHIRQWPETNFRADQLATHQEAVSKQFQLQLPQIDFANGREMEVEKIYPRSLVQPGAKPDQQVRLNVLVYQYSYEGDTYLLGCKPATFVPETSGEWFVDPTFRSLTLEYTGYAKNPRKILTSHREYIPALINCYQVLRTEFENFKNELNGIISQAMKERQSELEAFNKILSMMRG